MTQQDLSEFKGSDSEGDGVGADKSLKYVSAIISHHILTFYLISSLLFLKILF